MVKKRADTSVRISDDRSPGMLRALEAYNGSDGGLTRALYADLDAFGAIGQIAVNLFRANKNSTRAKVYRGGDRRGSWRGQSYDRKQWSLGNLCSALQMYAQDFGIEWGWKEDAAAEVHRHVLYVVLPRHGQCSFHSDKRLGGPDFRGEWDRQFMSAERIVRFVADVLNGRFLKERS